MARCPWTNSGPGLSIPLSRRHLNLRRAPRALSIKPVLNFVEGELQLLGMARSYQKGLQRLVEEVAHVGPLEQAAVMYTRRPQIATELALAVAHDSGLPPDSITTGELGPVLASHGGQGVMGIVVVACS